MKPEQLQKFYNMAEPRSEEAIRKAEERQTKRKDKELLLQDLSARLPYNVYVNDCGTPHRLVNVCWDGIKFVVNCSPFGTGHGRIGTPLFDGDICYIKPYLRPLDSLTDDELKFLDDLDMKMAPFSQLVEIPFGKIPELIDFFNSIHVDYRGTFFKDTRTGLIDQGLAISTEIHNPYKD